MARTAERFSADFDVDADGSFSFVVSAAPHDGTWLPIDGQTDRLSIREYVVDWAQDEPGRFLIERLGNHGQHPDPLASGELAQALQRAADWADDWLVFWNQLVEGVARTRLPIRSTARSRQPRVRRPWATGAATMTLARTRP